MERSHLDKVNRWSQNRSGTIILLGVSVIALMIAGKIILDFFVSWNESAELTARKEAIQEENDLLEHANEYLSDDYYVVYVRDGYQIQNGDSTYYIVLPTK